MGIWIDNQAGQGGNGGGETPKEVSWNDIQGKPSNFEPRPHKHQIEDVEELQYHLDTKVDTKDDYGLSQENFTPEFKNKLESVPEQIVASVNGNSGEVTINKESLNLENVDNVQQATKVEHEELSGRVDSLQTEVSTIPKDVVLSVNDRDGHVKLVKGDVGLSNVDDIQQATKEEFDNYTQSNSSEISTMKKDISNNSTEIEGVKESIKNIPSLPENLVESVNNRTGDVTLTSSDVQLEKVINEKQATKAEFDEEKVLVHQKIDANSKSIASVETSLDNKVDKVEGKGLSSNDFTTEYKNKIDNLKDSPVLSVNSQTGHVKIEKEDIGLSEVLNEKQATKTEFNSLSTKVDTNTANIAEKVDKVKGKGLSSNDFTDEYVDKLNNIQNGSVSSVNGRTGDVILTKNDVELNYVENVKQASETEFNLHQADNKLHLTDGDRDNINMIPTIQSSLDNKIGLEVFNDHTKNTTHITPLERESWNNKVDKEPNKQLSTNDFTDEYKTKIGTNSNEIEAIKELLGNGEEPVELPPAFKVYKEGHIYGLGGVIYDIVNLNIIKGSLAPRFVYDNLEFFEDNNFSNNTINIYYDGNVAMLENINDEESSYKGKLTNILSKDENVTEKLIVNNKEYTSETRLQYNGNTFNIPIRMMEMHDENGIQQAKIGLNLVNKITFSDIEEAHVSSSIINNTIVNNEFTFSQKGDCVIDYESNITYASSEGYTNQVQFMLNVTDNKFLFTENIEKISKIKYIYDNATLGESHFGNSAYLNTTIRDNVFDGEVTRVFKEELTYLSDKQKTPAEPILNNITIDHYLNQQMKLAVGTKLDSNELSKEVQANRESPLEQPNLKNIIISTTEPEEKHEGLIWIKPLVEEG